MKYFLLMLSCMLVTPAFAGKGDMMTVAGSSTLPAVDADGSLAIATWLSSLSDVGVDTQGNIYFVESSKHRVRMVERTTGVITTVVGTGQAGYSGDHGLATQARLNNPQRITLDGSGDLFVSDYNNHCVRKVDMATGIITTIVGSGIAGFSGDGGSATLAKLNSPEGLKVDATGNLYIADVKNLRIRKVDTKGVIRTVAGNGVWLYSGDNGQATMATLYYPNDVALDSVGNLYIADTQNHRIRKVDATTGVITTFAGTGLPGSLGNGGLATAAQLHFPAGVDVDVSGNVLIADTNNHRVQKVDAAGIVTTLAGNGSVGYTGDNAAANLASMYTPRDLISDNDGNVYIVDKGNSRIRMVGEVLNRDVPSKLSFNVVDDYGIANYFNSVVMQDSSGSKASVVVNDFPTDYFATTYNV
ncbi:MAG: NHL repeat-containing protein, partial [Mariprofundaceae bacterium]|nr:NHL repeat-containing protein [Mariprofundaceae bacterium]